MAPSQAQSCSASANAVVAPERTCSASPCRVASGTGSLGDDGTQTRTTNVSMRRPFRTQVRMVLNSRGDGKRGRFDADLVHARAIGAVGPAGLAVAAGVGEGGGEREVRL